MCDLTEYSEDFSVKMEDGEEDKMPKKEENDTEKRFEDQSQVDKEKDSHEENEDTGREEEEVKKEKVAKLYCGGHRGAGDCSVMMEEQNPQKEEEDKMGTEERSEDQDEIAEEKDSQEEEEDTDIKDEEGVRKVEKKASTLFCGGHRGAGDCSVMMGNKIPKKEEKETEKVQDTIVEENVDVEKEVKVEA